MPTFTRWPHVWLVVHIQGDRIAAGGPLSSGYGVGRSATPSGSTKPPFPYFAADRDGVGAASICAQVRPWVFRNQR